MNFSSLKLAAKALMLVSVLLLVEILFVGSYFYLLTKAEEETAKQEKAKMVVAKTNDFLNSFFEAGFNLQKKVFQKEDADLGKYAQARIDIPNDIAWLREQVRDDANQLKLLDRIDVSSQKALVMLNQMKTISETEAPMVAINYALKLRIKLQKQMEGMVQDLIEFMNVEKRIESHSPAVIRHQREYLRWLLASALLANICAAIWLSLLFVRSITSRLAVVVENSNRLRQRAVLRSPISGNDEIAQLDRAFHAMSSSLRGEEELVKANDLQLHAVIDQMPIGLMIIADKETIEYANPALVKLLGCREQDFSRTRLSNYFFRSGSLGAMPFDDASTVDGVIDLICRRDDRSEAHVEFSVVDVSLGATMRQLATVIDVTERHEVEELRKSFVAMVSHDLRTPLTSVAGFLQLLPMGVYGELASRARVEGNLAEKQVEQLIVLINDLLDLEKLAAGHMQIAKTKVSLEDVIDSALDAVYIIVEQRGVELIFEGCEIDVFADGERLKHAISKMLDSSLRLCSSGEKLEIVVQADADSGQTMIRFIIHQFTLSADKLSTIFDPFQNLDSAWLNGTLGLGFTLARAIAIQHGGGSGAYSGTSFGTADDAVRKSVTRGTTFWLQIPN